MTDDERRDATPMDYVRAHAAALGLDPDAFAIAAQAHLDQAQASRRESERGHGETVAWPVCPDCYESDTDHCGDCWCCDGSMADPCPDDCACHAYMPPGRVCSWCQQEGHEDR